MNLCLRTNFLRSNILSSLYRLSTAPPEQIEQNDQVFTEDTDEAHAREAEIEKKRNVSRLSESHYNMTHDRRPYEVPRHLSHLTVKWNRKMYGKYGIESGVNPSLCWPSKKDIQETLEFESVKHPFTIQEMINSAAKNRRAQQQVIEQREKEIAEKYVKLAFMKKDLADRLARKEAEALAAKEKKERLVEEVRRHFGFKLDPKDERFQEMLAKREKEQKKVEKQARRDAKEKVMINKLQQKNADNSASKS